MIWLQRTLVSSRDGAPALDAEVAADDLQREDHLRRRRPLPAHPRVLERGHPSRKIFGTANSANVVLYTFL